MAKITNVIVQQLYPFVEKLIAQNSNKFRSVVSKFIQSNHEIIFNDGIYHNILYNKKHLDELYEAIGCTEKEVISICRNIYYWDSAGFNPQCAKEPYVLVLFMIMRYYLIHKDRKNAELTIIYILLSGKFFASLWGYFFDKCPPDKHEEVMKYVVNNMLNEKFDLKKEGTLFGALKAMSITYLDTYEKDLTTPDADDDDIAKGRGIQQLRDREKSFFKNIANLYYEAYTNKYYLNYETDNVDPDHFRLTDSDATTAARITESAMNYLTSNYVSLEICNKCKDENVKALEIKDIIEAILGDNKNLPEVRKVINILICDFMKEYPGHRVGSVEFIAHSIKAKSNTKDKYLLEMKDTITKWLDDNSPNYRKRKSRTATAASYYKSILTYFVLVINRVANK